jgi:murein DD-endopeptidase MepM/ murein hydrolase activator NlpD
VVRETVRALPRRAVGLLVVGLVLVATPPAALGDPRAEQERIEAEVARAEAILEHATGRAQAAAARFAAADAALPGARKRVDRARGAALAAAARADTARREADAAEAELTAAGVRMADSVAEVDRARERVAGFAAAAYKGSRLAGVNLLLRARGPAEAVRRFGYLGQIAEVEQERVDALTTARLAARQAQNEATVAHRRAAAARKATVAALAEARAARAGAETAAETAAALAARRAGALEVAEAEREESLRRYERAQAEAARIEAELRAWEASRPAPAPGRGSATGFGRPTAGWQSSPFGMRFDPFFRVWQMHAGVDIAAPGGTPVSAVAGGTVIRAGWNGGYGNYTCLGHGSYRGQSLVTCYAHQSEILVRAGQPVERGELIGRVGTTGASTGNHLHFEVRLDGAPTDPVRFLPPS